MLPNESQSIVRSRPMGRLARQPHRNLMGRAGRADFQACQPAAAGISLHWESRVWRPLVGRCVMPALPRGHGMVQPALSHGRQRAGIKDDTLQRSLCLQRTKRQANRNPDASIALSFFCGETRDNNKTCHLKIRNWISAATTDHSTHPLRHGEHHLQPPSNGG